ncbi:glycosyltransferase family 4 protein [Planktothrix paucivesiculata]|uniref:Glycosyl transferases group 1: TPR repeat protein n=1 Tax=Planktothrix paucivesiculata PCC 9631 TaxID=671071 RepID=A0A7Z9BS30_9CYAN|nr:glycosyltransferase family 4 protein [Planktothrix paucivesiculata]VXD19935.1 Glycosyl transferases group 1: TPR repeat protein [Planktothrix paucivesiculata PCC 9631]
MKIRIEGWRFIPHTYSITNQFQLLELLKRSQLEITHQDIPGLKPQWKHLNGLFPTELETQLQQIPQAINSPVDLTIRISQPFNFKASNSQKTLVYATAPWGILIDSSAQLKPLFHLKNQIINPDLTIITPSQWSREGLIRSGLNPEQIKVIPWGVDPTIYYPLDETERNRLRKQWGWEDYFIFFHVGSLQDQDGIKPILRAFANIIERYPQARLVLKGSDFFYDSNQWLTRASREVLTEEEVIKVKQKVAYFNQTLSCTSLAQLYQISDAYLAVDIATAFNLSVLEAAASGLPIIYTPGGATEEIINPEFSLKIETRFKTKVIQNQSRFFLHPNWEHLTELMAQVINNSPWREQARKTAPPWVNQHYTWKHTVDQLLEVCQETSPRSWANPVSKDSVSLSSPHSIIVEGWRDIPHSYSFINSYQLLEMIKYPALKVFHKDIQYVTSDWKPSKHLLSVEAEDLLDRIPAPQTDQQADVTLRVYCPFNLTTDSNSKKTAIFGCTEWGIVPRSIVNGMKIECFREAHRNSDTLIITSSHWSREGFIRSGAVPERVVVIPLGIDPNIYHPLPEEKRQELRTRLGWNDCFIFLNIGVMWNERQGIDRILKAFAQITEKYPHARLVLKGRDAIFPSKDYLKQATQDTLNETEIQRISSRMVYIGKNLSSREMAQLYQAADAYVSPYAAEGFNLPVLEAIASGIPVICTDGGPTDDFTDDTLVYKIRSKFEQITLNTGETRFFLEPDQEHLLQLMEMVIQKETLYQSLQTIGPDFVSKKFTWKIVVEQLLKVLFHQL